MKKKVIALGLVGVMACAPMSVLADTTSTSPATGNGTGSADVEGIVELDVFSVDLPTSSGATFNFTLDPQELVFNTAGVAHSNMKPAKGTTVIFENDTDGDMTVDALSDTSDKVTVKNLGSVQVDVSVKATVTTDLAMSADNTFADNGSLYLALVGGTSDTSVVDVTSKEATLTTTLAGIDATDFEYAYDAASSKYTYSLKSTYDKSTAPSYAFALTGAANSDTTWVGDETASVEVVWTLEKHSDVIASTSISGSSYSRSSATNTYTITWATAVTDENKSIKSVVGSNDNTFSSPATFNTSSYSLSTDKTTLTIDGTKGIFGAGAVGNSRYVRVTFADNSYVDFEVSVTE